MNKLYVVGALFVAAMLGFTYVAMDIKGGMNGDIVNMLAIAGAVVLVIVSVFVVTKYVRQMQSDTASGELAEENWDSIGEYKNPLPMGWAVIFLGSIVWAGWYFIVGYPVNAYSQIGEYNEDSAKANAKFEEKYTSLTAEELHNMGESVFLVNCAPCHGLDADGMNGKAANLHKRIAEDSVKHVVNNGANNLKTTFPGGMPPMLLQDKAQIDAVAKYVANGFKADDTAGKAAFTAGTCNSCHGENGEGMPSVAPKINGWDAETVSTVLKDGKQGAIGAMPAFTNLNATQIKAVSTYITDISKGE